MAKNNANQDIVHIECIEGLASQIVEHISSLNITDSIKKTYQLNAIEGLKEWVTKDLFQLRKAFEG